MTNSATVVLSAAAGNQTGAPFNFGLPSGFSKLLILDPPTLQAIQSFDAFYAAAEALESAFTAMTPSGGAGAGPDDFADVTNAVAAAAIASTSETAFTFTIQDPTAAIVLLHHLRGNGSNVCKNAYYAGVYTVDELADVDINTVRTELNEL